MNYPLCPTYAQVLKFRWAALGLVALITFVLLANANQVPKLDLAIEPDNIKKQPPSLAAAVASGIRKTPLPDHNFSVLPQNEQISESISIPALAVSPPEESVVKKYTVKNGDTLSGILDLHNVHSSLPDLIALKEKVAPLLKLSPGNSVELKIKHGKLSSLVYETSLTERLEINHDGKQFKATSRTLETTRHEAHAFGLVTSSFYKAGIDAGLSDKVIISIANILGWDIDFGLDVQKDDYFSVIYEEEYLHGEKLRDATIQAVEFVNNGKVYRAVFYKDPKRKGGHFSPDGRSMRKPFLRNPIEYTRISSHFSLKRLHPISKTVRPHRGIDYAAPRGTPIRVTGDGKVIFSGRKLGYGNVIIVSHGRVYSTLYAHLSKFASGISRGKRIRQGQIIGYVGSTGYATGPHLHYEFRINGVHKNPLTIKLPDSAPLPEKEMALFRRGILSKLAKLDTLRGAYPSPNSSF